MAIPCKIDTIEPVGGIIGAYYAKPAPGRSISRVWSITVQDEGSGAEGDVRFNSSPTVLFTADGGTDYRPDSMVIDDSGTSPIFYVAFYKYDGDLNETFWRIRSFSSTGSQIDSVDLTPPTPVDPINDISQGPVLRGFNTISNLLLYSWGFYDFGPGVFTSYPFHIDSDLDSGSITQWDTERDTPMQIGAVVVAPTGQVWSFQPQDGSGQTTLSLWNSTLTTKEFDLLGELFVSNANFEIACNGLLGLIYINEGEGGESRYTISLDGDLDEQFDICVNTDDDKLYPHDCIGFIRDFGGGGDGVSTNWHLLSCPAGIPPLRQQQRDDFHNAPRNRFGPQAGGIPSSIQESLRNSWGSNTYLMDRETCGC